jgi:hypothetical protein
MLWALDAAPTIFTPLQDAIAMLIFLGDRLEACLPDGRSLCSINVSVFTINDYLVKQPPLSKAGVLALPAV